MRPPGPRRHTDPLPTRMPRIRRRLLIVVITLEIPIARVPQIRRAHKPPAGGPSHHAILRPVPAPVHAPADHHPPFLPHMLPKRAIDLAPTIAQKTPIPIHHPRLRPRRRPNPPPQLAPVPTRPNLHPVANPPTDKLTIGPRERSNRGRRIRGFRTPHALRAGLRDRARHKYSKKRNHFCLYSEWETHAQITSCYSATENVKRTACDGRAITINKRQTTIISAE